MREYACVPYTRKLETGGSKVQVYAGLPNKTGAVVVRASFTFRKLVVVSI